MVGMGFATLENILYTFNGGGFGTALGRAITAVPAHGVFAIVMGSYVGLAKFVPEKRHVYLFQGVGLAVVFHGLYDFFLLQQTYKGLAIISLIALSVGITRARQLVQLSQEMSPFKDVEQRIANEQNEYINNAQNIDNQALDERDLI